MFRTYFSRYTPSYIGNSRFSSTTRQSLIDNHGRVHNYLRISLTEKCNLRCRYCMPEEGVQLSRQDTYLSLDETKRLADIFVKRCGINKIRLTGGEPTIDKKLYPLLEHLHELRLHGLETVAMTTNGVSLKRSAKRLKNLGINSINISLDSMREDRFELLTRRKGLKLIRQGIMSALEAKFDHVKINCVIIKSINDDELCSFVELARSHPVEVRFIEFMPFAGNKWDIGQMMPYKDMLKIVMDSFPDLERVATHANDVSKIFKAANMLGSVGFISSMSDHFCSGCNRLRITSDGNLKVCLFGRLETSLRDLMRNGASDEEIVQAITHSLKTKKSQHAGARCYHSSTEDSGTSGFSHLDGKGRADMVNIGTKPIVRRVATAQGSILVGDEVLRKIRDQAMKKGDIISVARIAGIMGAKLTSNLIPLCHSIPLDHVRIYIDPCEGSLVVKATTEARHNTGVEMEALTAVTVTLLTIYDMCKSVNKGMIISDVKLLAKSKF